MAKAKKREQPETGYFNLIVYKYWMFPALPAVQVKLAKGAMLTLLLLLTLIRPAFGQNSLTLIGPGYVAFTWQGDTLDNSNFPAFFSWIGVQSTKDAKQCADRAFIYLLAKQSPDSLDVKMREVWQVGLTHYACFCDVQERKARVVTAKGGVKK